MQVGPPTGTPTPAAQPRDDHRLRFPADDGCLRVGDAPIASARVAQRARFTVGVAHAGPPTICPLPSQVGQSMSSVPPARSTVMVHAPLQVGQWYICLPSGVLATCAASPRHARDRYRCAGGSVVRGRVLIVRTRHDAAALPLYTAAGVVRGVIPQSRSNNPTNPVGSPCHSQCVRIRPSLHNRRTTSSTRQ